MYKSTVRAPSQPDPRVTRTVRALEEAIVGLASQRPVSQITVAELAERAGVTRATFYNRFDNPLALLIEVLDADLERGHRREDERRADAVYSAPEMLRLATAEVADHVERFRPVYRHALHDPADRGVYDALTRHFTDYSLDFIARCTHPDRPGDNHQIIATFVPHGFAGAIAACLRDPPVPRNDLAAAPAASAPPRGVGPPI